MRQTAIYFFNEKFPKTDLNSAKKKKNTLTSKVETQIHIIFLNYNTYSNIP